MTADILIAEIGSTITKVHAVGHMDLEPKLLGQGFAPTTVDEGDVMMGLEHAIADLAGKLGCERVDSHENFASSSAAGGLKMTAHGLTYDMTLRAAREACLGAGAVMRHITAGAIRDRDLETMDHIGPNIILLAGGVDFGEAGAVLDNARKLTALESRPPVVYAGNSALRDEVAHILTQAGFNVSVTENVYPRVDQLNLEPVRRLVREIFSRHIITAPGMDKVRQWAGGEILPTPGAVLIAAELLAPSLGDLAVIDIGGATTDVHSVTDPTPEIASILSDPVPRVRRTVEGDLGVYRNAANVMELLADEELEAPKAALARDDHEVILFQKLAAKAADTAMERHAGEIRLLYTASGPKKVATGSDLSGIHWLIGTGGVLSRLPGAVQLLESLRKPKGGTRLLPGPGASTAVDRDYILSACGTMAEKYPDAARTLALRSLGIEPSGYD